MKTFISIQGSIVALFLCVVLAACGSAGNSGGGSTSAGGSSSGSQPSNAAMQQGQWEFVATSEPTTGGIAYLEANLTNSGSTVSSSAPNTLVATVTGAGGSTIGICNNANGENGASIPDLAVNGNISGNELSGQLGPNDQWSFQGSVAANGQSVTSGTFSGTEVVPPLVET